MTLDGRIIAEDIPIRMRTIVEERRKSHAAGLDSSMGSVSKSAAAYENRAFGVAMTPRVIDTRHAGGCPVWLRFANGVTGEIDLKSEL